MKVKYIIIGFILFVVVLLSVKKVNAAENAYYEGYSWDIPFTNEYPYWIVLSTIYDGGVEMLVLSNSPFQVKLYDKLLGLNSDEFYGNYQLYSTLVGTVSKYKTYQNGVLKDTFDSNSIQSIPFYYGSTGTSVYIRGFNYRNSIRVFNVLFNSYKVVDQNDSITELIE